MNNVISMESGGLPPDVQKQASGLHQEEDKGLGG